MLGCGGVLQCKFDVVSGTQDITFCGSCDVDAITHLRRLLRISAIASENGRVLSEAISFIPLSLIHICFPQARVLRMDMDTTRTKDGYEQILSAFSNHEADILIGTQMIVKGHDLSLIHIYGKSGGRK